MPPKVIVIGPAPGHPPRQLHVDWAFVTQGGDFTGHCADEPYGRSAHAQTLIEVLTADDDDENLSDGTPHRDEICAAFAEHGINDTTLCGGSRPSGRRCSADCDHNGSVDPRDLACFSRRVASGDRRADCNRDGIVSAADVACFASLVSAGFE